MSNKNISTFQKAGSNFSNIKFCHKIWTQRLKQSIICCQATFKLHKSNIFIAFPVFKLKNRPYITNCQLSLAASCRHFVGFWLVGWLITNGLLHILKVEDCWKLLRYIIFIAFYPPKIKNLPTRIIFC